MRYFLLLLISLAYGTGLCATQVTGNGANSDLARVLTSAVPNTTVVVPSSARILLTSGLKISQPGVTLQCESGSSLTKGGNFDMLYVAASNVSIVGCTFDGAQALGLSGLIVRVKSVDKVSIIKSTILNGGTTGIQITDSTHVEVANNSFSGSVGSAIGVAGNSSSVWIHDNAIDASTDMAWHEGICAHSTNAGSTLTDISIMGNAIRGAWSFCVEVGAFGGNSPQRIVVSNNTCDQKPTAHGFGGYSFDAVNGLTLSNNVYTNATSVNPSLPGIELVNGTQAVATNNKVTGANISVNKQTSSLVDSNTVVRGFAGCGIYVGGTGPGATTNYNIISNNTIDMRNLASNSKAPTGILLQANSNGFDFSHNQILGNKIVSDGRTPASAVDVELDYGTLSDILIKGNQFVDWQTCYTLPQASWSKAADVKVWNNDETGCNTLGTSVLTGEANGIVSYRPFQTTVGTSGAK